MSGDRDAEVKRFASMVARAGVEGLPRIVAELAAEVRSLRARVAELEGAGGVGKAAMVPAEQAATVYVRTADGQDRAGVLLLSPDAVKAAESWPTMPRD